MLVTLSLSITDSLMTQQMQQHGIGKRSMNLCGRQEERESKHERKKRQEERERARLRKMFERGVRTKSSIAE